MPDERHDHRIDYFDLGDGYELRLTFATAGHTYFTAAVFAPMATTSLDSPKVKIAERLVRNNQVREVRWAKRRKRIHMRARKLALT